MDIGGIVVLNQNNKTMHAQTGFNRDVRLARRTPAYSRDEPGRDAGTQLWKPFLIKPKWTAALVFNNRACNNRPWTGVLSQVLSTVCVKHVGIWTGVCEMSESFSHVTKVNFLWRADANYSWLVKGVIGPLLFDFIESQIAIQKGL